GIRDRTVTGVQTCALPICEKGLEQILEGWQNLTAKAGSPDTETDIYDLRTILEFGIPIVICYGFIPWPMRCGLGIGALLLAHTRSEERRVGKECTYRGSP